MPKFKYRTADGSFADIPTIYIPHGVGKKYYDDETVQGEIFGDYETNAAIGEFTAAFGSGSTAGQKGYYMSHIGAVKKDSDVNSEWITVIALSDSKDKVMPQAFPNGVNGYDADDNFVSGFSVGDQISIINNGYYYYCASITDIDGNLIFLDRVLPFDIDDTTGAAETDNHIIFVPAKPKVGVISFTPGGFAAGLNVVAGGKGAFACGRDTVAAGGGAFVAGRKTKAGYIGTASGLSTSALGDCSFTANSYTTAAGNSSTAFGAGTTAKGLASFSCGSATTAEGTGAFSAGINTSATVDASTAFGKDTNAQGTASFASGVGAFATGSFSFAANNSTVASGEASSAFGMGSSTSGIASFATGSATRAIGKNSFTWGEETIAEGDNMQAGGKYNFTTKDKILVYGKGVNNEAREDAYILDKNGNGWYAGDVEASAVTVRSSSVDNDKKFKLTVDDTEGEPIITITSSDEVTQTLIANADMSNVQSINFARKLHESFPNGILTVSVEDGVAYIRTNEGGYEI